MSSSERKSTPGEAFERLVAIMNRLRDPGGCPWDREQTFQTLRPYLVEEAAEALEALDKNDLPHFSEELGDLLLQVVFHAKLGSEIGVFDIVDVVEGINRKMVSRHPHVFAESDAKTADEVLAQWDQLKAAEKAGKPVSTKALKDLPPMLPALQAAQKTSERAAKLRFDWPNVEGVWAKLKEEMAELQAAPDHKRDEELGDLLFAAVNLARHYGLDAEGALARASAKFRDRFERMHRLAGEEGKKFEELTPEEMDGYWSRVK